MQTRCELLRAWVAAHQAEGISFLERLVNQDSGTYDRACVNRVGDLLAGAFAGLGFGVSRVAEAEYGDHLVATRPAAAGKPWLLCIGHMDTVFPAGTAAERPFRIDGERATGPGVLDMKGGLAILWLALRALEAVGSPAQTGMGLTLAVNSDEEVGSFTSRALFATLARRHQAAIVLEPARPDGECVIGRKGVGHFRVEVAGRQAHAGVQPELGVNAVWELARKVCAIQELSDPKLGTTVNVGMFHGGDRVNVIPDYAVADVDVRVWSGEEVERVTRAIRAIAAQNGVAGATAKCSGQVSMPPWPANEGSRRMLAILQEAAAPLSLRFGGITTGGGSDGNWTATLIPTLDGLGAVGNRMHSPEEFIDLASLQERTVLLALFLERWCAHFSA